LRKTLINLLKFGVALALLGYLVYDAWSDDTFAELANAPKHWGCFAAAFALCMGATCLTMVRWYYLVRALELPFRMADAFRLGFLGYLLNFFSLGSVGGDLFKAVFIAREQKRKRAEAVATVVIDRVIGLYVLFVVATVAAAATGMLFSPAHEIQEQITQPGNAGALSDAERLVWLRLVVQINLWSAIGGAIFIGALLVPGFTQGRLSKYLRQLPRVGHVFGRLLEAIRMYRTRPGVIALTCVLSIMVHVMNTVGIYLIARGLSADYPSLGAHFIIVSLAMVVGALPITPSGLGAFEGTMDFLYRVVPGGALVPAGEGLLVAFGYRAITIAIALVGVVFYLRSRRDVAAVWEEAEHLAETDDQPTAPESGRTPQERSSEPAEPSSKRRRGRRR